MNDDKMEARLRTLRAMARYRGALAKHSNDALVEEDALRWAIRVAESQAALWVGGGRMLSDEEREELEHVVADYKGDHTRDEECRTCKVLVGLLARDAEAPAPPGGGGVPESARAMLSPLGVKVFESIYGATPPGEPEDDAEPMPKALCPACQRGDAVERIACERCDACWEVADENPFPASTEDLPKGARRWAHGVTTAGGSHVAIEDGRLFIDSEPVSKDAVRAAAWLLARKGASDA